MANGLSEINYQRSRRLVVLNSFTLCVGGVADLDRPKNRAGFPYFSRVISGLELSGKNGFKGLLKLYNSRPRFVLSQMYARVQKMKKTISEQKIAPVFPIFLEFYRPKSLAEKAVERAFSSPTIEVQVIFMLYAL